MGDIEKVTLFGRKGVNVFVERPSSLKEIIQQTVSRYGSKEALFLDEDVMTYNELDRTSTALAASLQRTYRIGKGDRVACLIGNRMEFAVVVFACMKIGAIMVPINIKLRAPEIAYIVGHCKPSVLILDSELLGVIVECNKKHEEVGPYTENMIVIGEASSGTNFASLLDEEHPPEDVPIEETDAAFILYTSGTTGRPKGAIISHINVVHSVIHYKRRFQSDDEMRTMLAVPFFHVTGLVAQFWQMVFVGGSMVILKQYQNEKYIKQCYDFKVNCHFNVPTIFIMMATSPLLEKYSFDFVRKVAYGGSPIYKQTLEKLQSIFPNATYHNAYGATETTSPTTIMPESYPMSKATSVGLPVDTAEVKVIDGSDRELGVNEIGELLIKGPMVIGEYWDNPDANESSFIDGFWRSGDVAKIDDDGFVYILDRKKDMINRGGEKIYSIEVEDVLKGHPEIVEAAVVSTPDEVFGERVKAFIVSNSLGEKDRDEIRAYCGESLAKFKVPEVFEFIDELPKNASGKILKHTLR